MLLSLLIFSVGVYLSLAAATTSSAVTHDESETDMTRKILGSSVVTSVSVIMDAGNGSQTVFSDAAGKPVSRPALASQLASPINLLNPDRYEFYTFDDKGDLVKRLMTLDEIQGIIASGDGEATNYNVQQLDNVPKKDVNQILSNVQNVLRQEIESHQSTPDVKPLYDTPDVSSSWSMILPAIFGNSGDEIQLQKPQGIVTPDTITLENATELPSTVLMVENKINNEDIEQPTEHVTKQSTESEESTLPPMTLPSSNKATETLPPITEDSNVSTFSENRTDVPIIQVIIDEKLKQPEITSKRSTTVTETTNSINAQNNDSVNKLYTQNLSSTSANDFHQTDATENPKTKTTETILLILSTIRKDTTTINPTTAAEVTSSLSTTEATKELSSITEAAKEPAILTEESKTEPSRSTNLESVTDYNNNNYNTNSAVTIPISTIISSAGTEKQEIVSSYYDLQRFTVTPETPTLTTENVKSVNEIIVPTTKASANNEYTSTFETHTTTDKKMSEEYNSFESTTTNKKLVEEYNIFEGTPTTTGFEATSTIPDNTEKTASTAAASEVFTSVYTESYPNNKTNEEPVTANTSTNVNSAYDNDIIRAVDDLISQIMGVNQTVIEYPSTVPSDIQEDKSRTEPDIPDRTNIDDNITISIVDYDGNILKTQSNTTEKVLNDARVTTPLTDVSTFEEGSSTILESSTYPENVLFKKETTTLRNYEDETSSTFVTLETTENGALKNENSSQELLKPSTENELPFSSSTVGYDSDRVRNTSTRKNTVEVFKDSPPKEYAEELEQENKVSTRSNATTTGSFLKVSFHENAKNSTVEDIKMYISSTTIAPGTPVSVETTNALQDQKSSSPTTNYKSSTESDTYLNIQAITSASSRKPVEVKPISISTEINPTVQTAWKLISTIPPPKETTSSTESKKTISTTTKSINSVDLIPDSAQGYGLEETTAFLDTDIYRFTELCNELSFSLWSQISKSTDASRSIFLSPFATTSMLAMVFLGARGATSGEMNEVLKLDDMVTFNPHSVFKNVTDTIEISKTSGIAASVILRELYSDRSKGKLLSFYKERVRHFYDGHVEEVSFAAISDIIRRRTNLLVKRYTWGKIHDYLKDNMITARPPLAAVTASIFQTDCSLTSTTGRDGELHFVFAPNSRQRKLVPIPAAVWKTGFLAGYDPSLDATAVSIGTTEQSVSTIFVIPGQQGIAAPGDGLSRLEERLTKTAFSQSSWSRLLRSLIPRPGLEVQIPRFAHRSVINTTIALEQMGLKELFSPKKADLKGLNGYAHEMFLSDLLQVNYFVMCGEERVSDRHYYEEYPVSLEHPSKRGRDLKLFQVIDFNDSWNDPKDYQRAFDESLFDTSLLNIPLPLRPRQARVPDTPRLRFDRPFLYFVRHNPTGLILHMGRFNPKLQQ